MSSIAVVDCCEVKAFEVRPLRLHGSHFHSGMHQRPHEIGDVGSRSERDLARCSAHLCAGGSDERRGFLPIIKLETI